MPLARYYRINSPSVINETIEGESVIINLNTGIYYSLDNIGAIIWDALEQRYSAQDISETLARHYRIDPADVDTIVNELIDQLSDEQLIVLLPENKTPSSNAPTALPSLEQTPFAKPVLHKFGDMQDLLLLDPIHEVDEAGWPYTKPEKTP